VDGILKVRREITHEVKMNVYFKEYIEMVKIIGEQKK